MSKFIFSSAEEAALQYALTLLVNAGYDRPIDPAVVQALRTVAVPLRFAGFADLVTNAPIEAILRLIQLTGGGWQDPISPVVPL
jgi:hypothetical protein